MGGSCRRSACYDERAAYVRDVVVGRGRRAQAARRRQRRMKRVEHDLGKEQWIALRAAWGGSAYCGASDRPLQPRLRTGNLPWRPLHARQRRAFLRLVQRQQVQRRSHRLAAPKAPRRASVPVAPLGDPHRAPIAVRPGTGRRSGCPRTTGITTGEGVLERRCQGRREGAPPPIARQRIASATSARIASRRPNRATSSK